MGHNINMVKMFGDFLITCPHCGHVKVASNTELVDIDIDGNDCNPSDGIWRVSTGCYMCNETITLRLKVKVEQI